jgi:hypothetical protein
MSDYNNSVVGGSGCAYAKLATYNNGSVGMSPPVPRETVIGSQVVPVWQPPTYNTLMHGDTPQSCSGYFNIINAYGQTADNCQTTYVKRMCQ